MSRPGLDDVAQPLLLDEERHPMEEHGHGELHSPASHQSGPPAQRGWLAEQLRGTGTGESPPTIFMPAGYQQPKPLHRNVSHRVVPPASSRAR